LRCLDLYRATLVSPEKELLTVQQNAERAYQWMSAWVMSNVVRKRFPQLIPGAGQPIDVKLEKNIQQLWENNGRTVKTVTGYFRHMARVDAQEPGVNKTEQESRLTADDWKVVKSFSFCKKDTPVSTGNLSAESIIFTPYRDGVLRSNALADLRSHKKAQLLQAERQLSGQVTNNAKAFFTTVEGMIHDVLHPPPKAKPKISEHYGDLKAAVTAAGLDERVFSLLEAQKIPVKLLPKCTNEQLTAHGLALGEAIAITDLASSFAAE
jgi:hypothetical protein